MWDLVISQGPGCDVYRYPGRQDLKALVRNDFLPDCLGNPLLESSQEGEYITALLRLFSLEVLAGLDIGSHLAGSFEYPRHNLAKDLHDLHKRLPLERTLVVFEVEPMPYALTFISHLIDEYWDEYAKDGTIAGVIAPAGLEKWQELPKPQLFISTIENGKPGQRISTEEFLQKCPENGTKIIEMLRGVFTEGCKFAEANGLILLRSRLQVAQKGDLIMVCDDFLTANCSQYISADNLDKIRADGDEPVFLNNKALFEELADLTLKDFQHVYLL